MTEDTGGPRRLTRDELAAAYGYSRNTLARLWEARATNGHPPARPGPGRTLTWDADEWRAWDRARHEIVGTAQFAALLGHKDSSWVSKATSAPPEGFPEPVEWGDPEKRQRPKWRLRDINRYIETRDTTKPPAGAGSRPGSTRPSTPYAGDPRLALARQVIAEHPDERPARLIERLHQLHPGPSASTWTKILQAARDQPEKS